MLLRYVGGTLLILGGAMLVAPSDDTSEQAEPARASVSAEQEVVARAEAEPADLDVGATESAAVTLASAQMPATQVQPALPVSTTEALSAQALAAPSALGQSGDTGIPALALEGEPTLVSLLADGEDRPVPSLEVPGSVQEASITSETLTLIAIAEGRASGVDSAAQADLPEPDMLYVTGSRVNVRSGPSTSFGVISSVAFGDAVELLSDDNESWAEIRLPDQTIGFMSRRFLADEPGG